MKFKVGMILFICAVSFGVARNGAQEQVTAEEQKKRVAVSLMRSLNTAQVTYASEHKRFANLEEISAYFVDEKAKDPSARYLDSLNPAAGKDMLPGFEVHITLATDGRDYAMSVKEVQGRFRSDIGVFTDTSGVIYVGKAL